MYPCMRATLTPHVCMLYDFSTQTLTHFGNGLVLVLVLEVAVGPLHRTQPIGD
jgi:hypothetical protein